MQATEQTPREDLARADGDAPPPPRSVFGTWLLLRSWLRSVDVRSAVASAQDIVTVAFVAVFHRVMGASLLHAPYGFDEHYFLWEGYSVTRGMVPYRDFQEFKPPMIFIVNALGLKLFGLEAMRYREFFHLLSLAGFAAIAIALLSRRVNRLLVAALLALMIGHFFYGGFHDSAIDNSEGIGLDFFLIGTGILLTKTRWERTQLALGGVVLALVPLSKEPFVFVTIAAWLSLLVFHQFESRSFHATRRFALFTIGGALSVAAVWFGYMLVTHSLSWYVVQLKESMSYSNEVAIRMGWFPKSPPDGVFKEVWHRLRESYLSYGQLSPFLPLFVAAVAFGGRRSVAGWLALLAFVGAVYGVTVGHGFIKHYFVIAMAGTFFASTFGAIALGDYAERKGREFNRWLGLWWLGVGILGLGPQFLKEQEKYADYKSPNPPVNVAELTFVRTHTTRSERIWTLGDPLLYVYADRLNAIREGNSVDELIDCPPGQSDEECLGPQRAELERARPKVVVFGDDEQLIFRKQRRIKALVMPFLNANGYTKISDKFWVRP
ncbi:MAG TPA: hypothetical protein VGI39_07245 [Polyangiaceae bacterium]